MRHRMFRPPYVYRWAVLITALATIVWLTVSTVPFDGTGSATGATADRPLAVSPPSPQTSEQPSVPPERLQRSAGSGRTVALTFDDGPHPVHTPQVLTLLAQYRAVATFCLVGREVERHPELVREIVNAGMALCAHTNTHDANLPSRSAERMEQEVGGSRQEILRAAGPDTPVTYFRAPAGNWSEQVQATAARHGMRSLSWSVDSRDWKQPAAAQIVATVQADVHPAAIVLLHDGGGNREQTVIALAQLLPWLVQQGYRFVVPG